MNNYPISVRAVHDAKHPFEPCENSFDVVRHLLGQEYIRRFLEEQKAMIRDRCKYMFAGSCSVFCHYGMLPELSQFFTGVTLSHRDYDGLTYDPAISWERIQLLYSQFTSDVRSGKFEKFLRTAPCSDFRTDFCIDRQELVDKIAWIKVSIDRLFKRLKDLHQKLQSISERHGLLANIVDDSDSKGDAALNIEYLKRMKGAEEIHALEGEFFELVSVGYSEILDAPQPSPRYDS